MELLHITKEVNEEIKKLLNDSIIGTPGHGMLYQHKSISERITKIKSPFFVELRTKQSLIGTCCFCYRETQNVKICFPSFYIRYFSFRDSYRAKSIGRSTKVQGRLRREVNALFENQKLNLSAPEKYFHYAYVDTHNTRSVSLCNEFRFEKVREFTTFVFSRLNPRIDPNITFSKVRPDEVSNVKAMLTNLYADFTMLSFENIFNGDNYYVVKDAAGKIIAGANVSPSHWKIYKMQSRSNTLLLSFLTRVPVLNRLVNRNFKFLAIDGLYFTEGNERYTEILLSSVLKKFGYFNALIPSDNHSILYSHLTKLNLGMVSKISKKVSTNVICRFHNFSNEETENFRKYPAYISAIDIT